MLDAIADVIRFLILGRRLWLRLLRCSDGMDNTRAGGQAVQLAHPCNGSLFALSLQVLAATHSRVMKSLRSSHRPLLHQLLPRQFGSSNERSPAIVVFSLVHLVQLLDPALAFTKDGVRKVIPGSEGTHIANRCVCEHLEVHQGREPHSSQSKAHVDLHRWVKEQGLSGQNRSQNQARIARAAKGQNNAPQRAICLLVFPLTPEALKLASSFFLLGVAKAVK
mmetsp:Transcript_49081/g.116825  ORF Transcript_49081/g.116825 Transcript_49081/m.116825 type:complete len:222 (-) Transcript_49081:759-1424(-)